MCIRGDETMIEAIAASDLWERALQRIQSNLSGQTYETWFRSLAAIELDSDIPSEAFVAIAEILSYVYKANSTYQSQRVKNDE